MLPGHGKRGGRGSLRSCTGAALAAGVPHAPQWRKSHSSQALDRRLFRALSHSSLSSPVSLSLPFPGPSALGPAPPPPAAAAAPSGPAAPPPPAAAAPASAQPQASAAAPAPAAATGPPQGDRVSLWTCGLACLLVIGPIVSGKRPEASFPCFVHHNCRCGNAHGLCQSYAPLSTNGRWALTKACSTFSKMCVLHCRPPQ